MVHSSSVLRVRLEPGIPKLLVKINPTDAESFHAKNLGEVILRKGVTSRSQVAVLHMSRGTAAGEVLMSVKLADLLDLEDGQGVEVAAAAVPTAPTSLNSAASRGRVPTVAAVNAPRQECTWERTHNHGLSPEFGHLNGFGGSGRGVDPGGSFEKRHSPEKGTATLFDNRASQDNGRKNTLRSVHSARGVRERNSLPTRANVNPIGVEKPKDDGYIRTGLDRRPGFMTHPEAAQDADRAQVPGRIQASSSRGRPGAVRQGESCRGAAQRPSSGFGFLECFGRGADCTDHRGAAEEHQAFYSSSVFDTYPTQEAGRSTGSSMRSVHTALGMQRNNLPSRAPAASLAGKDKRAHKSDPSGFPHYTSTKDVDTAEAAAANVAAGHAVPAPAAPRQECRGQRPSGFGFLDCLGRHGIDHPGPEKSNPGPAPCFDKRRSHEFRTEEEEEELCRNSSMPNVHSVLGPPSGDSLPSRPEPDQDAPKERSCRRNGWDPHFSFPSYSEDHFDIKGCKAAGAHAGESGASSRAASTPSSPPESSPSEGESGGSSAGSHLSSGPNSSVSSKDMPDVTKTAPKVRSDCGTVASDSKAFDVHEASTKQRRASISLPLVLLPSHDASKSSVGSTPGSSGSSLKRRDSTSSLLRRRRTSTLGLLQQELAEPLKGSISRSKVPDHWLPPSDAEAGSLERSELGAEATAEVRRWLLGHTSGQQCSQVILDRALTVLSNFKLASGCELEVLGGPLGALVGGYSDADWLFSEVFKKHPSDAIRESFALLGFRNRFDGDWSSTSVEEISLVYRRMCLRGHPSRGGSPKDYLKLQVAMELIKAFCGDAGPLQVDRRIQAHASLPEGPDAGTAEASHFVLSDLSLARELQLSAAEASKEASQLSAEHLEEMNRALDEYILRQMCFKSEIVDEIARLHEDSAYAILGVSSSATDAEIKKAYRLIAMQCHPDKGGDKEDFQELTNAYEKIMEQRRSADDRGFKEHGHEHSEGEEPTPVHGKSQAKPRKKESSTCTSEDEEDGQADKADGDTAREAKRAAQEDTTLLEKASKAAEEASRYAKTAAEFAHQAAEAAEAVRRDQEQGGRETLIKSVAHSAIVYTLTVVKAVRAVGYATLDVAAQCRAAAKRNPDAVSCAEHAVSAMSLGLEALNSALSCAEVTEITAAELQAPQGDGRSAERFAGAAVRASLAAAGASNVAMSSAIAAVEGSRQCAKALEKSDKAGEADLDPGADEATEAGEACDETESSGSEPDAPPTPKQAVKAANAALQRLVAQRNNNHKVLQRLNAEILGHQRNVREFLCQNRQLIPQVPAESKLKIFRLLRDYAVEAWADLSGDHQDVAGGPQLLQKMAELPLLVPFLQPQSLAIPVSVKARVLKMAALYDLPLAMRLLDEELLSRARHSLSASPSSSARLDELTEKIRSELISNAEEEAAPIVAGHPGVHGLAFGVPASA
mmetsp:Transcript_117931/g.279912  ORF Transcript_117931/g.279912 Transcript_117931/m.279912 type:complete len:1449 (+) Transcript_117931:65-4411(+)